MADKVVNPTMDEPSAQSKPQDKPSKGDNPELQAILEKIQSLGIEKPEQLDNISQTASQVGRYANQLGELRQQNQQLMDQIQELKVSRQPDLDYGSEGQTIDLSKVIRNELKGFYSDLQREQRENQMRMMQEFSEVQQDPDYHNLKPVYEEHIQKPDIQVKLMSGQTTYEKEYNRVMRANLRSLSKQLADITKGFTPDQVKPPHMETNQQTVTSPELSSTELEQKLKDIRESRKSGDITSDQALDAIISTRLSKDDLML